MKRENVKFAAAISDKIDFLNGYVEAKKNEDLTVQVKIETDRRQSRSINELLNFEGLNLSEDKKRLLQYEDTYNIDVIVETLLIQQIEKRIEQLEQIFKEL